MHLHINKSKVTDEILITSYLAGNTSAFNTVILRHEKFLFNFINKKIRNYDISCDLKQDIFIKVIDVLHNNKYKEQGKFLPWLLKVAHNHILDYFRKENRINTKILNRNITNEKFNNLRDQSINIEENIDFLEDTTYLKKIVATLPIEQRDIIHYRFNNNLTFKEISEIEKVGINTSLGRMRYAIVKLKYLHKDVNGFKNIV